MMTPVPWNMTPCRLTVYYLSFDRTSSLKLSINKEGTDYENRQIPQYNSPSVNRRTSVLPVPFSLASKRIAEIFLRHALATPRFCTQCEPRYVCVSPATRPAHNAAIC